MRYTILFHDGFTNNPIPEPPNSDNQAATLADARRMFSRWLEESGNDYQRAEGYGEAYADVVLTECWDDISYGDGYAYRLTRGPKGGVHSERFW